MERYLCIHGHFYQPPREDPWTGKIPPEESALPYHDWNERITQECYLPNSAATILDDQGRVAKRVNNYSRMSFDFGPTLLAWMEEKSPAIYQAILASDREASNRFSGHGSALACAYNHIILPLADPRDKVTQIRWGILDFEHRFGRSPEGVWLPETAVDLESLDVAASQGLRFTILAPHQARGVPPDPSRPYTVRLPSGRPFSIFFYDGPISRAVAYEKLLSDGETFLRRLGGAFLEGRPGPQLIHIATDGETFGHHHKFGDMALAYLLDQSEEQAGARLTNYGEFLERHPPEGEVEIVPNTSWSCSHGVERWRGNCGCRTGSDPDQSWRALLREGVDWLREQLAPLYEEALSHLLKDPWEARNESIRLHLDRSKEALHRFFEEQALRPLKPAEVRRVLGLLRMQRHLLFMFTSCGWFFDTPTGPEVQIIIRNALRAIELARETLGEDLEKPFLQMMESVRGA